MRKSRSVSGAVRLGPPAVASVAVAAMLLLGACGGDGGGEEPEDPQASQETQESGGGAEALDVEGTWVTDVQAPFDVLVFQGASATYTNDAGDRVCLGDLSGTEVKLACENGELANATLRQDGESLSVTWEGETAETFQRLDDAALDQIPGIEDIPGMEELQDLESALEGALEGMDN